MRPSPPQRQARRFATATPAEPTRPTAPSGPLVLPAVPRALYFALAATLALRALAPLVPGRYAWGIDLARDLPPLAFWLPWATCALALVPSLSAPLIARLPRSRAGLLALVLAMALGSAALARLYPERAFLTGDTALRHGDFAEATHPEQFVPQALPADLLLHYHLPRVLAADAGLQPEQAGQLWGALLAFLNALAAWNLARAVSRSTAASFAALGVAGFTAALTLFNGYAKSIVELNVLALFAAAALASIARDGRGTTRLGLATGAALIVHRSALALLPAWVAGLIVAGARDPKSWRRPGTWVGALAPLAALAVTGPRSLRTLQTFDASHHLGGASHPGVAWLAASLSAFHLHDALQVVLLTSPLAVPLMVLLAARPAAWRRPEMLLLGGLALPQLVMLVFVHPQQGLFRDWDVFVTVGVALSGIAAWLVAEAIDAKPGAAWLALPVFLAAATPSIQWLAHQSDVGRALARGNSILAGPPERPYTERAMGYDHIGITHFQRNEFAAALVAYRKSLAAAPNPRLYVQSGMAETMLGRPADALADYLHAVRLDSTQVMGWRGIAATSSALNDLPHMEQAALALTRLDPNGPTTRDALEYLKRHRAAQAPVR